MLREEGALCSAFFCNDFRREITPVDELKFKQPSNASTVMSPSLIDEDTKNDTDCAAGLSSLYGEWILEVIVARFVIGRYPSQCQRPPTEKKECSHSRAQRSPVNTPTSIRMVSHWDVSESE